MATRQSRPRSGVPPLSLQDKLALTLTSAGTVAGLARSIGVSPRTMGRWLRKGKEGGIREIPTYATKAINQAFKIHTEISRSQATADGIPFTPDRPVFAFRPIYKDGKKGLRVFVTNTQFFSDELKIQHMGLFGQTEFFYALSVRSVVDWRKYKEKDLPESMRSDYDSVRYEPEIGAVFTRKDDISRGSDLYNNIVGIYQQLMQKMAPNAYRLADQYVYIVDTYATSPRDPRFVAEGAQFRALQSKRRADEKAAQERAAKRQGLGRGMERGRNAHKRR